TRGATSITPAPHATRTFPLCTNKSPRRAYNAGLKPHTEVVNVPLFITYDAAKVTEYANKVAGDIKRDPRDARVAITIKSIGKIKSKDGRAIDAKKLADSVGAALAD